MNLLQAQSPAATDHDFEIRDVFSNERLLGNPLAVFPNATGTGDGRLSAIAQEMAHSESTFVFPRSAKWNISLWMRKGWTRNGRPADAGTVTLQLQPVRFRWFSAD